MSTTDRQRKDLLDWSATHLRDLPWRHTRDPWAVLVSEVMSQQTQLARVVPRFEAFLASFPDAAACAAASTADIIRHWDGLGYNRRALNLHRCAVEVTDHHGGQLPDTLEELMALPGIGPYTARAVLAFAFEADVGVVDTNVARILARWQGAPFSAREVQTRADELVAPGTGWRWNQSMLDLGALVCTKPNPSCGACPVSAGCAWGAPRVGGAESGEPDPAVGSAGVSGGQSRFEGSDRQGRGRLISALRANPVNESDLAAVMGWPADLPRAQRVAQTLIDDGMVKILDGSFHLPGDTSTT